MNRELLNKINSPADLKSMPSEDMPALCKEIRSFLIEKVEKNGGHLASNLGVTELSVALHRVFDSPRDHVIFDVGHQAYVHKIITGRKDKFDELRLPGGLSGFTKCSESEHDPFGAGHSSTSISAALGFAEAEKLKGSDATTVCVIGDGAYTGGMVHEAFNNCKSDLNLVIVLNENRMSISKNKGAFASYLAKVRISKGYRKWKHGTVSVLTHIPLLGKPISAILRCIKNKIKSFLYSNNYFENLGMYYIGPINGNDYATVEKALAEAKRLGGCTVVHTFTKKGKGYEEAEKNPDGFHSVSPAAQGTKSLHSVFADELINIAKNDSDVVAITAAMGIGTGLTAFEKAYPERYYDVGIAEEHALTFSAGLAAAGMKPYVAIYSTFLQRSYDNILHDVALQNLPVRMMIDRAGLALSDGATHHGIFDVSFLMHIPGVELYAPVTYGSLCKTLEISRECSAPIAIRYANTPQIKAIKTKFYSDEDFSYPIVKADYKAENTPENVFITYGNITDKVIEAQDILAKKGINCGIILCERLKPLPISDIYELVRGAKRVVFVEEGILNGGFSMICEREINKISSAETDIAAIEDNFANPSEKCDLYDFVGLSAEKIANKMISLIK